MYHSKSVAQVQNSHSDREMLIIKFPTKNKIPWYNYHLPQKKTEP